MRTQRDLPSAQIAIILLWANKWTIWTKRRQKWLKNWQWAMYHSSNESCKGWWLQRQSRKLLLLQRKLWQWQAQMRQKLKDRASKVAMLKLLAVELTLEPIVWFAKKPRERVCKAQFQLMRCLRRTKVHLQLSTRVTQICWALTPLSPKTCRQTLSSTHPIKDPIKMIKVKTVRNWSSTVNLQAKITSLISILTLWTPSIPFWMVQKTLNKISMPEI